MTTFTFLDGRPVAAGQEIQQNPDGPTAWDEQTDGWRRVVRTNGHKEVRPKSFTAFDLQSMDFPEPRFAVPGILTEGLNVVAGAPKLGKSWWALGIALAVASGGRALGQIEVERGEVHYLALEDSPRRLKDRLSKLLGGDPAPRNLYFSTEWLHLNQGGIDAMHEWLSGHPGCRSVIVDVYARVRPRVSDRADRYLSDYESAQGLKALADEHSVAIAALHHTRKAGAEDFVETVSGTFGLAAVADTIIVCKRARGQADATLQVTGRDVEEQELALRFAPEAGTWALLGDAKQWAVSEQRRRIIETLEAAGPLRPKQIADETELDHGVVKHLVRSMVDDAQLDTDGSGLYFVHRSLHSPIHSDSPPGEQSERGEGTGGQP